MSITLEVYGDFAMFTSPTEKDHRVSYAVPTPSAIRGLLSSIYSKPAEFYWQVDKIEVLNPIAYMEYKTNEVKVKASVCKLVALQNLKGQALKTGIEEVPFSITDHRTQRYNVVLRDVRYRITATIVKQQNSTVHEAALVAQAKKRIHTGACFRQPYFGMKEYIAYFTDELSDLEPISETKDLGIALHPTQGA